MITKPMVMMRLYWESKDLNYDKEDRKRFANIRRVIGRVPIRTFNKIFIINGTYEYYIGFCIGRELKVRLDENEFDIVRAIIENIRSGYYKKEEK